VKGSVVLHLFRTSVVWQFVGGFALGTVALVSMQSSDANRALAGRLHIGRHHLG
jgi:hypothetical protein